MDDYLDEQLGADDAAAVENHLASCDNCRKDYSDERELRTVLTNATTPIPSESRLDGILRRASRQGRRRERRLLVVFVGGALAASLAIWAVSTTFIPLTGTSDQSSIAGLRLALHETMEVKLVMDSPRELKDAVITLKLPKDIELVGYPGRRMIAWKTNVHQGKNMLVVPVVAKGYTGGELVAEVSHNNKRKNLVVILKVVKQETSRNPSMYFHG